jgi:hypothetical protein
MVLQSQLPVGGLDLPLTCSRGQTQYFMEILGWQGGVFLQVKKKTVRREDGQFYTNLTLKLNQTCLQLQGNTSITFVLAQSICNKSIPDYSYFGLKEVKEC